MTTSPPPLPPLFPPGPAPPTTPRQHPAPPPPKSTSHFMDSCCGFCCLSVLFSGCLKPQQHTKCISETGLICNLDVLQQSDWLSYPATTTTTTTTTTRSTSVGPPWLSFSSQPCHPSLPASSLLGPRCPPPANRQMCEPGTAYGHQADPSKRSNCHATCLAG